MANEDNYEATEIVVGALNAAGGVKSARIYHDNDEIVIDPNDIKKNNVIMVVRGQFVHRCHQRFNLADPSSITKILQIAHMCMKCHLYDFREQHNGCGDWFESVRGIK